MPRKKASFEVVKYLLANSAYVNSKRNDGFTALHMASTNGHIGIVKELINANADVNAKSKKGTTPLMRAAISGNLNVVIELLAAKADINIENQIGNTAVDYASNKRHYEIEKELVSAGATTNDFRNKNKQNLTKDLLKAWKDSGSGDDLSSLVDHIIGNKWRDSNELIAVLGSPDKQDTDNNIWLNKSKSLKDSNNDFIQFMNIRIYGTSAFDEVGYIKVKYGYRFSNIEFSQEYYGKMCEKNVSQKK